MMLLKKYATFTVALFATLFLTSAIAYAQSAPASKSDAARKSPGPLGTHPYLGWSSWSLQATTYPGYGTSGGADYKHWLTAEHVKAQADIVHAKLQAYGYQYINLDSGWRSETFDDYGRPQADKERFPQGIANLAAYVHRMGLKLGVYYNPGLPEDLYRRNPPIVGTGVHLQDIAMMPLRRATGWNSNWRIDFTKPGAQAYLDSIAQEFADWGVDFLKLDGVTPGSDRHGAAGLETDGRAEVAAWDRAIKATGRRILARTLLGPGPRLPRLLVRPCQRLAHGDRHRNIWPDSDCLVCCPTPLRCRPARPGSPFRQHPRLERHGLDRCGLRRDGRADA